MNGTPKFSPAAVPVASVTTVPRLAVSLRELSQALGVCERTLAQWVREGAAPPSFTQGRLRLFAVSEVERWLVNRTREAAEISAPCTVSVHRPGDDTADSAEIGETVQVME